MNDDGSGSGDRRGGDRRSASRRGDRATSPETAAAPTGRDLIPAGEVVTHDRVSGSATAAEHRAARAAAKAVADGHAAPFAAQILGQGGQRNGIKGGPPVLDTARAAYLGNEYSGDRERRPPVGKSKRTDV